jgi:hypothetical protein
VCVGGLTKSRWPTSWLRFEPGTPPPPTSVYAMLALQRRPSVVNWEAVALTALSSGDTCCLCLQKRPAALQVDPELEGSRTRTNSARRSDRTVSQPRGPCDVNCCWCLSVKPGPASNKRPAWLSNSKKFAQTVVFSCAAAADGYQMQSHMTQRGMRGRSVGRSVHRRRVSPQTF